MFDDFIQLGRTLAEIQFGAQRVIMLRMMRLARGDAAAFREARRMTVEKIAMGAQAGLLLATGEKPQVIANRVKRAVNANERRLLRRSGT